jgi:hypothetical protein
MWAFIAVPVMSLMVAGIIIFKNIRRRNVPVETTTRYRNTVYPSYRDEVEAWKVAFFNRPDEAFY